MEEAVLAVGVVRAPGGVADHVLNVAEDFRGVVENDPIFRQQQGCGAKPLVAGSGIVGAEIDNEFTCIAGLRGAVDETLEVGHVVAGEARDEVDGELRVTEGGVAMAEEGIADGARGRECVAMQFRVEEGQFGIDGSAGLQELFAFAIDAEGNSLGGDDVEDRLGQFAARKAAADGSFDGGFVDWAGDSFVRTSVYGADVGGGDGAFVGVVLADGGGDGRLFVDDDQDLRWGLGLRGQGECGEGRQEWKQGADIYTVPALVNWGGCGAIV